jgi:hypothetical protein
LLKLEQMFLMQEVEVATRNPEDLVVPQVVLAVQVAEERVVTMVEEQERQVEQIWGVEAAAAIQPLVEQVKLVVLVL